MGALRHLLLRHNLFLSFRLRRPLDRNPGK
jgi:hypothetical protein